MLRVKQSFCNSTTARISSVILLVRIMEFFVYVFNIQFCHEVLILSFWFSVCLSPFWFLTCSVFGVSLLVDGEKGVDSGSCRLLISYFDFCFHSKLFHSFVYFVTLILTSVGVCLFVLNWFFVLAKCQHFVSIIYGLRGNNLCEKENSILSFLLSIISFICFLFSVCVVLIVSWFWTFITLVNLYAEYLKMYLYSVNVVIVYVFM